VLALTVLVVLFASTFVSFGIASVRLEDKTKIIAPFFFENIEVTDASMQIVSVLRPARIIAFFDQLDSFDGRLHNRDCLFDGIHSVKNGIFMSHPRKAGGEKFFLIEQIRANLHRGVQSQFIGGCGPSMADYDSSHGGRVSYFDRPMRDMKISAQLSLFGIFGDVDLFFGRIRLPIGFISGPNGRLEGGIGNISAVNGATESKYAYSKRDFINPFLLSPMSALLGLMLFLIQMPAF
jgi:hypothetical protein